MSTQNDNNGFLYFMSGLLLVAVCVVGYMAFVANDRNESISDVAMSSVESAAGEMERAADNTSAAMDNAADEAEENTSELSVEMDEDGFTASQTTENN